MQKAYGNRPDALIAQLVGYLTHRCLVQGDQNIASEVHAFRDTEAQVPRHQRTQFLELQVIQDRADPGLDLQQVSEPFRRYEGRF